MATPDPADWVTRAADDAVRHHERTGADGPVTCSSGISPSGPVHLGNLREFLMPHFVAEELRRRGVPVRHLHVWDDYDRFRKVPRGVDPSCAEHIGRPAGRRARPVGLPRLLVDPLQGAGARDVRRAGRRGRHDLARPSATASGVYRDEVLRAVRHRAEIDAVLAQHRTKKPAEPEPARRARGPGGRGDGRLGRARRPGRRRRRDRRRLLPVQALLPRLRPRHDHGHGVRRRDHRPRLRLLGVRLPRHHQPGDAGRGQAGLEGRLADALGLRARRLRAGRHGPRDARVVVHGRPRAGRVGRGTTRGRRGSATASSASPACRRCRRRPAAPRPPQDALRVLEPRHPALALRAPPAASRPSTSTSGPRSCGCTTSGTRWAARPPTPPSATRRCSPTSGPRRPRPPARCRAPAVVVPFRMLASVADVTAGSRRADQPDRRPPRPRPRLGRRPGAAAVAGDGVDRGVRAGVRPHDGARRARRRAAGRADRARSASGWRCCSTGSRRRRSTWTPVTALVYGVPKLARGLALDDTPTDEVKADQKEFFGLLYHLLVDADRGPAPADPDRGPRRRPGPRAAQPPDRPCRRCARQAPSERSSAARVGAGVAQELRAALPLVGLADRAGGQGEQGQAAQEAAVGLVLPRHRAVALPAVAAQQVEAAVVADPGVGVDGHVVGALLARPRRRGRPRRPATPGGGVRRPPGALAGVELGGGGVHGQVRGRRTGHQVDVAHVATLPDVGSRNRRNQCRRPGVDSRHGPADRDPRSPSRRT